MEENKNWKIVVTDYIEEELDWEFEKFGSMKNVTFEALQLKHAEKSKVIDAVADADIIVVNMVPIEKDVIESLTNCKLIIRHGVGYDNVDVKELTRRGILLINIPDYCVEEVAEQAVMHIITCARKYLKQQESMKISVKKGEWDFDVVYPISLISYKKLGIIGCGRIGGTVLKLMRGFDMDIHVCDPYLSEEKKRELGIDHEPLERVLKECDIITVHTPLNEETRHMIGREQFQIMKNSAIIINTARGGIVDELALVDACNNEVIAGAALDVYEYREPPKKDSKLLDAKNLNITPHLAWYSVESEWKIRERIVEQIIKFVEGNSPDNIINKTALNR